MCARKTKICKTCKGRGTVDVENTYYGFRSVWCHVCFGHGVLDEDGKAIGGFPEHK